METAMQQMREREPTAQEWAQRRRDWWDATASYRQAQYHIYSLAMPSYAMLPGGRMERTGDGLTPEMRAVVEKMNEFIDEAARHFGLLPQSTTQSTPAHQGSSADRER